MVRPMGVLARLGLLALSAVALVRGGRPLGVRGGYAAPFSSLGAAGVGGGGRRLDPVAFHSQGDAALSRALNFSSDYRTSFVNIHEADGVSVWRAGDVVLASCTIDAQLEDVVATLRDANRTREYNPNCAELREIERYDDDGQITYSVTGAMGPFKRRDFVTAVHWRRLEDGSVAVVNHAVDDDRAPESDDIVRSEVILGAQLLRPLQDGRTEITLLSALDLGGAARTPCGAALQNKLAEQGPVQFIRSLEAAARRSSNTAYAPKAAQRRPFFDSISRSTSSNGPAPLRLVYTTAGAS
ncbi:hypothetical protein M885DRAFT_508355 [Pelagophyceae sp. CCMP2097]|nr:hypothetical protein M885DRAFT_508355 [Pelagophyceae sp. CCMP2097]